MDRDSIGMALNEALRNCLLQDDGISSVSRQVNFTCADSSMLQSYSGNHPPDSSSPCSSPVLPPFSSVSVS
jgi:hypothetical protein